MVGHNRIPYGEVPDGNQVAEATIPAPVIAGAPDLLGQAEFVQEFHDESGTEVPSHASVSPDPYAAVHGRIFTSSSASCSCATSVS